MTNPVSVDDLVLRWQELRQEGKSVSAEELCKECPELAPALRQHIEAMKCMESFLGVATASGEEDTGQVESRPKVPAGFLAAPEGPDELGRLGPYRVLRPLGAGGMGLVFEAEDSQLRRRVALKVMRPHLADDTASRRRFVREAQAMAAVEHEHVVSVYQVGEEHGVPFLAMPLLRGEPLEARLHRDGKLPLAEVLRIGREAAEGLAAAHARGLVHRDVKPANLWLEENGRLKVLDFGLARATDGEDSLTQTGNVLGTPRYMAPEQLAGEHGDARCDLFSLGCVLYRMCTGRAPFAGENMMAIVHSVAVDQPARPDVLNPEVGPELADLIVRLLSKAPADRPASARQVADALRAIEQDRTALLSAPVVVAARAPVRPAGPSPAGAVPAGRKRRLWWAAAALVLAAGLGAGGWLLSGGVVRVPTPRGTLVIQTNDPTVKVVVKKDGAVIQDRTANREIELAVGDYEIELAEVKEGLRLSTKKFSISRGGKETVKVWLEKPAPVVADAGALDKLDPAKLPPATDRFDWRPPELVAILGEPGGRHWGNVVAVAIRPDGKQAASCGLDSVVRLWDVATGRQQAVFAGGGDLSYLADGKRLAVGGGGLVFWDVSGPEPVRLPPGQKIKEPASHMTITPDGRTVAVHSPFGGGQFDYQVTVWDLSGDKARLRLRVEHGQDFRRFSLSDDGRLFAAQSDKGVRLWDLTGAEPKEQGTPLQAGDVRCLALSPDGKLLVTVTNTDGALRLWDLSGPEPKEHAKVPVSMHVDGLTFTPNGKRLLMGSQGGCKVFAVNAGRLVEEASFTSSALGSGAPYGQGQALTPDGRTLVAAEGAGLRFWDLSVKPPREIRPFDFAGYQIPFSEGMGLLAARDGPRVVSWAADGTTRLWDFREAAVQPAVIRRAPGRSDDRPLALSPDGRTLATWGILGGVGAPTSLWDLSTTPPRRKAEIPDYTRLGVFTPDGKTLALGMGDHVALWDVTLNPPLRRGRLETNKGCRSMVISADGQTLAWTDGGAEVQLWDLGAKRPALRAALKNESEVSVLAFAPDRPLLACVCRHGTVLWELGGDKPLKAANLPTGQSGGNVSFSPDGRSLVASGPFHGAHQLTVWDVASAAPRARWTKYYALLGAAFAHDSRHLFTLNGNGTITVLRLPQALPPLDPKWAEATAKMTPDKQVEAVAAELRKRNPGFDGKLERDIDLGKVVELRFRTEAVNDISPLRVLKGLKILRCRSPEGKGKLVELSPLYGLPLQTLDVSGNPVTNLGVLEGMPLTELNCSRTRLTDLSPLRGMRLQVLSCEFNAARDDEVLRSITTLHEINGQPAADFWRAQAAKQPPRQP